MIFNYSLQNEDAIEQIAKMVLFLRVELLCFKFLCKLYVTLHSRDILNLKVALSLIRMRNVVFYSFNLVQ